ncbi:MAG: hypothetical protein KJ793_01070 [Candidatus Omnitrophica bacterium]|nr:hypothetical protein [Candidatus Omnitrophota bacterium]
MAKVRYEVDAHNRLVVKSGRKTELKRFRRVVEGSFKTDKKNQLTYHIKAPVGRRGPHQVKFQGKWSLNKNHDLRLTLDKWRRQTFGDQLTLKGDIVDLNKNSLVFAVGTRTNKGKQSIYLIRLQGAWQADKNNRLTFRAGQDRDNYDTLTFEGIWGIGKDYEIIYRYTKAKLRDKPKQVHTLIFKGKWKIRDQARIAYEIDKGSGSGFNFKTSVGVFKDRYIKYEVGVGTSGEKQTIKLFGRWKIKKDLGLIFEVKRGYDIVLGAEAKLSDRDSILFKLKDTGSEGEFELRRALLKGDGQAFIRFLKSKRESAVFVGVGRGW